MQLFLRPRARMRARAATIATSAVVLTVLMSGVAHAAPPDNDAFAGATPLTAVPVTAEAALAEATAEPGEPNPSCTTSTGAPSAWFTFTAPRTEWITLARTSYDWDTVLAVYTGESLDGLTEVLCTDYERRVLAVTAGRTYRIQLTNRQPETTPTRIELAVAPTLKTQIARSIHDPSTLDTVTFYQYPSDNLGAEITRVAWDFGDGTTANGPSAQHRYQADGDYVVRVNITAADGRTATATLPVPVRTHDVRVAGFTAPTTGRVGQTTPVEVTVANQRIPEHATVVLYRGDPSGFHEIARTTQYVPARPNGAVAFPFNYTFTPEDAAIGKVTFRTVVLLAEGARDIRPIDNEAIAPATTVRPNTNEVS